MLWLLGRLATPLIYGSAVLIGLELLGVPAISLAIDAIADAISTLIGWIEEQLRTTVWDRIRFWIVR